MSVVRSEFWTRDVDIVHGREVIAKGNDAVFGKGMVGNFPDVETEF